MRPKKSDYTIDHDRAVGLRVRYFRNLRKVPLKDLALAVYPEPNCRRVRYQWLWSVETGVRSLSAFEAIWIARRLGISIRKLLGRSARSHPATLQDGTAGRN